MARARQLEDDGGQLLGQLPRPDQPSLQRPGPEPLPRPPAVVARGPVREPQQARLCQRALGHLPRRGRQRPPLHARRVEGDDAAVPGVSRRDDARGRAAARHVPRAPGAARQPLDLPERDPRAAPRPAARPAQDRVLAFRARGPGYARGFEARDPDRQPSQQRSGRHVRAGRRRQLASGDRCEYEPLRAPAPPGSVDGSGARGAASGLSGARLRALHLGEQPAPLLSALGRVHERGELGRHPARPDQGTLRRHRDDAGLATRTRTFGTRTKRSSATMSQQQDLLREIAAASNSGAPDRIGDWFTEDFRLHEPGAPALPVGHAGASQMRARFRTLVPPINLAILDMVEEGDRVAVRWQLTATYDGKPFEQSIMAIYRFERGRIAEDWGTSIRALWP